MTQKRKSKKKNRRQEKKYPNLNKQVNLKSRQQLLDYDYLSKLTHKEKKWLDKFSKEYINASLDAKKLEKNLHNTPKLKKDCYDRNNARNRDLFFKLEMGGVFDHEILEKDILSYEIENELIKKIDEDNQ